MSLPSNTNQSEIVEITISFFDTDEQTAAHRKTELMNRLDELPEFAAVEGVVAGVMDQTIADNALENEAEITAMALLDEGEDCANVSLYLNSSDEAKALIHAIIATFGRQGWQAAIKVIRNEVWQAAWDKEFRPFTTQRFQVAPFGESLPTAVPGKISLVIDPGKAFGTGQHATTLACLLALEQTWKMGVPKSFLDVGTGTGILAIAAALLQVPVVDATEVDLAACQTAASNAKLNGVHFRVQNRSDLPDGRWQQVACNILTEALVPLVPSLVTATLKGEALPDASYLFLSGYTENDTERFSKLVLEASHGSLTNVFTVNVRGWVCQVFSLSV